MTVSSYSRERIKAALIHFLLGKVMSGALNFALLLILVRHLSPSDYGAYLAFFAAQAIALSVSSLGIEPTIERYVPTLRLRDATGDAVCALVFAGLAVRLGVLVVFCAGLYLALSTLLPLLGLATRISEAHHYVWVIVGIGAMNTVSAILDAFLLQKWSQGVAIVYALVRVVGAGTLAVSSDLSLGEVIGVELTAAWVATVLGVSFLVYLLREQLRRARLRAMVELLRPMWARMKRFCAFNFGAQSLMQIYGIESLRLLVTRLLGVTETARYGLVTNVMDLVQRYLPAFLLIRLIRPIFISRYTESGDFGQINRFARLILKLNLLAIVPLIALAGTCGDAMLSTLSGGVYANEGRLLLLGFVLLIPTSHQWVVSIVANTVEKNELQFRGAFFASVGLAFAWIGLTHFGVEGAFVGSFVSATIYNIHAVIFLRQEGFDYSQDLRAFVKLAIAGFISWGGAFMMIRDSTGLIAIVIAAAAIAVVYLPLVVVLRIFDAKELSTIRGALPNKVQRFLPG